VRVCCGPGAGWGGGGLAVPVGECDPACFPALVGSGLTTGWGGGPDLRIEDCDSRRGRTCPPDHWGSPAVIWRKSQSSYRKDVPDPGRLGFGVAIA